jgi:O-antigen/teichoic acid export membrane protein
MAERPAVTERWSSALASYYMVDIIGLAGFLLLTPRMIAHFGATQYGVLALAAGLTGYLGLLDLGIKPALTRMVGAAWAVGERSRVEALLRLGLAVLSLSGGLALGAAILIASDLHNRLSLADGLAVAPFVVVKGAELAIQLAGSPFEAANYAMDRVVRMNAVRAVARVMEVVAGVAALVWSLPLVFLAWASLATTLVGVVLQWSTLRERLPGFLPGRIQAPAGMARELAGFAGFYLVNSAVVVLIFRTDEIVIAGSLSLAAVAIYAPLNQVAQALMGALAKIPTASGPKLAIHIARQERTEAADLLRTTLAGTLGAGLVLAPVLLFFGAPIASMWLRQEISFALVASFVAIIVAHLPVAVASRYIGAAGIVRSVTLVSVAAGLLNLGLSIFLVQRFGLTGVACGTLFAQLVTTTWFNPRVAMRHAGLSLSEVVASLTRTAALPVLGSVAVAAGAATVLPLIPAALLSVTVAIAAAVRVVAKSRQVAPRIEDA